MKRRRNRKSGQTLVEYILIVVIVAIAAIAIVGVFSDRIRAMFGGATVELGGDQGDVDTALQTESEEFLTDLDETGAGN